jgi:hypothetical protein
MGPHHNRFGLSEVLGRDDPQALMLTGLEVEQLTRQRKRQPFPPGLGAIPVMLPGRPVYPFYGKAPDLDRQTRINILTAELSGFLGGDDAAVGDECTPSSSTICTGSPTHGIRSASNWGNHAHESRRAQGNRIEQASAQTHDVPQPPAARLLLKKASLFDLAVHSGFSVRRRGVDVRGAQLGTRMAGNLEHAQFCRECIDDESRDVGLQRSPQHSLGERL